MFLLSVLLELIVIVSSYKQFDFVFFDDLLIRPVKWTNEDFTLVINHEYQKFTLKETGLTEENLFISEFRVYNAFNQWLFIQTLDKVTVLDLSSRESKSFARNNFFYLPKINGSDFWRFETKDKNDEPRKFQLIATVLDDGKVQDSLVVQLKDSRYWLRKHSFIFNKYLYLLFEYNREFFVLVRVLPSCQGKKLNSVISAGSIRTVLIGCNFLPTKEEGFLICLKSETATKLEIYGTNKIEQRFNSAIQSCQNISDGKKEANENSLRFYLKEESFAQCSPVDKIPITSIVPQLQLNYENATDIFSYYLSHDFDQQVFIILNSNSTITKCLLETGSIKNCTILLSPPITREMFSHIAVDTRTGHFLFSNLRKKEFPAHIRIPMFNCADFNRCDSCEITGFYHNCKWDSTKRLCRSQLNLPDSRSSTCRIIKEAKIKDNLLVVKFIDKLRPDFGESFYVMLGNARLEVDLRTPYELYVKNVADNLDDNVVKVFVRRPTGGEVYFFQSIRLEEKQNGFSYADIILLLTSVIFFAMSMTLATRICFKRTK